MRPLHEFLGLTVGIVTPFMPPRSVKPTLLISPMAHNEFGFDYLRDNMAFKAEDKFQRGPATP
jgi:preprotein translocase subunit SecA